MSGPFGPSGTEAVVKVGIFDRRAALARAMTLFRSVGTSMSLTSWNRPLWWSMSNETASLGSIIHLLKVAMSISSLWRIETKNHKPAPRHSLWLRRLDTCHAGSVFSRLLQCRWDEDWAGPV